MERNINHMNHTNSITGTKADQVVLSFEKLKALRERKLTTEEADFQRNISQLSGGSSTRKNYRPTTGLMLLSYAIF